ncbi:MAG: hypothetical protein OXP11_23365 [Gammaproteobacteria bacterium]|nr:hypothetical protein [Gammaproteobacteria bacterium]
MARNRLWTEREDALVERAAEAAHACGRHGPGGFRNRYREVGERIGRSENAVQLRAQRIGVAASLGWERR